MTYTDIGLHSGDYTVVTPVKRQRWGKERGISQPC